jgi:ketosteroid isomerase-like protein
MKANKYAFWIFTFIFVVSTAAITVAQTMSKSDAVAAITKLENDGVKADLANDKAFFQKVLADDWTGGDSMGAWFTKADVLKMANDPKNNNTKSETLSDLKVRAYGDIAVATYKDSYDGMMNGQHMAATVIGTDTWVKMGGEWKQVASHTSKTK